ncbi:tetratricopeptide repeat protein [Chloroflexota bacterium]
MRKLIILCTVTVLLPLLVIASAGCQSAAVQHNTRGCDLGEQGQYDEAISEFGKAIELDPNRTKAYYNRGLTYALLGKKAEAIADFEKFITLTNNPRSIEMARHQIEELSRTTASG